MRELRAARSGAPGSSSTPIRRRSASAAARRRLRERRACRADAQPRQRLLRGGAARVRRTRAPRARARAGSPDSIDYVAELKIDGLSIALTYEDGVLVRAAHARRRHARRGRDARTSAPSARSRCGFDESRAGSHRGARRGVSAADGVRAHERASARRRASRCSRTRGTRRPERCDNLDPALVAQARPERVLLSMVGRSNRVAAGPSHRPRHSTRR